MDKKRTHNIGLAIWRLKCFYETFVQGSTAGILLNFCAKNPPHRQAENRWYEIRLRRSKFLRLPYGKLPTICVFRIIGCAWHNFLITDAVIIQYFYSPHGRLRTSRVWQNCAPKKNTQESQNKFWSSLFFFGTSPSATVTCYTIRRSNYYKRQDTSFNHYYDKQL